MLDELVADALAPMLGMRPPRDEDGHIGVLKGTAVTFVRTNPDLPVVHVWAQMVLGVRDGDAAAAEAARLNRETLFGKVLLDGDMIIVSVDLPAAPFVGEHLRSPVHVVGEVASRNDAVVAWRTGGQVFAGWVDVEGQP